MARAPKKKLLIESHPRDMPLKKLQRLARAAGLGTVGKSYVQRVRAGMPRVKRSAVKSVANAGRLFIGMDPGNGASAPGDASVSYGDLGARVELDGDTSMLERVPRDVVNAAREPGLPASESELRFFSMLVQIGTKRAHELLTAYEGL
jgi:hypothetical protein